MTGREEAISEAIRMIEESLNILNDMERIIGVLSGNNEDVKGPIYGLYVDVLRLYDNLLKLRKIVYEELKYSKTR
ncbi:MAG: hypothetical protein ABWW69_01495 [Pyrodictiaceae archaeon]